jgi:hypothetical protein
MRNFFLLIFFLSSISVHSKCQTIYSQTISSLGSSNWTFNSELIIHQSIGQSSISGNFNLQNNPVHQGFLKGIYPIINSLEAAIILPYPNPFQEKLILEFFPFIEGLIKVTVYDLNGKMVHEMDYQTEKNKVNLDLEYLSNSVYLVLVSSKNQVFQTRIIKK